MSWGAVMTTNDCAANRCTEKTIRTILFATSLFGIIVLFIAGDACAATRRDPSGRESTPTPRCIGDATIQLKANPVRLTYGQAAVVTWEVAVPAGCSGLRVRLNGEAVGQNGSRTYTPARSARYTVSITDASSGSHAELSESTTVRVDYPARVLINSSTAEPVAVLLGALDSANPEQTVELCGVDLDLTGITSVVIGDHRSLIASPECARGPRSFGPRIFVTDTRGALPLFDIRGDHVRFSGFRLEGPTRLIGQGDNKEKGIRIWPFGGPEPIRSIEISNMEILYWSGVGVEVGDNTESAVRGRLFNTNPGAVHIIGNYFHHNRHGAGEGYGVASVGGAYALIEQNVFDENRHAIAGGSRSRDSLDYSGYTARDNLILSGGGEHCSDSWVWALVGWRFNCWQTHQIDMHGDQNEWYSGNNWECGTAGETILIERNSILYTSGHAIKIRGNPADKVVIDGNVFLDGSSKHAIAQNGRCGPGDNITRPLDIRANNTFGGSDPTAAIGTCDFVGDGKLDQFMATGVTWWAKSPLTQQWRYLNTMPETLAQLQLRKIDSDAVCDVGPRTLLHPEVPPLRYSKSGTGPWRPVHVVSDE